jgi:hypothetical protein
MDTASGVSVTEWTAMNYSAFWAANKVFGEALGILPLRLMKKKDGGSTEEVTDHDLVPLIEVAPNPEMTALRLARDEPDPLHELGQRLHGDRADGCRHARRHLAPHPQPRHPRPLQVRADRVPGPQP